MKLLLLHDSRESESVRVATEVRTHCLNTDTVFEELDAAAQKLHDCIGCFGCWIKSPGVCVFKNDDGAQLLCRLLQADLLLIACRISFGCYSPAIKTHVDRMLPLLHPYFRVYKGKLHHRQRYPKRPKLLTLGWGATSQQEAETFRIYTSAHQSNLAQNLAESCLAFTTEESVEGLSTWLSNHTQVNTAEEQSA